MARIGIKELNAEFAHHGFELVKGDGYFYFVGKTMEDDRLLDRVANRRQDRTTSIYVAHFNQMPVSRWRSIMADMAQEISTIKNSEKEN